jgi:CubicO group peptidase (beta-lactamase class C family)
MKNSIETVFTNWLENEGKYFSGVFSVTGLDGVVFQQAIGYRNKAEELPNTPGTAFGIASGTKLFTGLAICKLIDEKKLSLTDKLSDLLSCDLGQIDKRVTVFHLLTHTSSVGDYIDEENDDCDEQLQALYDKHPVQLWTRLEYYLQMITPLSPKFKSGERFGYSNSGFILLGLIVEAVSGIPYQQYVRDNIILPCKLVHTDFYRMDSLPANTAHGYTWDENATEWRTNIFGLPILGGSDGGLYTCAADLDILWRAIFENKILSEEMTQTFLKHQATINEESGESYGLGVYRNQRDDEIFYSAVGGDCGVEFFSIYFPQENIVVSTLGNSQMNTYTL